MTKIKIFLFSCLMILSKSLFSQGEIGSWTVHTACGKVVDVDKMGDRIFAATNYDVFHYDLRDNSLSRHSRVNGLSDFGAVTVRHSTSPDLIFIGYTNGNVDLLFPDGKILNIPDIKEKNIIATKEINNVMFHDKKAYISCGFGIVVVDLQRYEVKETYLLGKDGSYLNINDLALFLDKFYAATDEGLFVADASSDRLVDFSEWHRDTLINNPYGSFNEVEVVKNHLVANFTIDVNNHDTLYFFNGQQWDYFSQNHNIHRQLRASDDRLVCSAEYNVSVYTPDGVLLSSNSGKGFMPLSAIYDGQNRCYWHGDMKKGLVRSELDFSSASSMMISSPFNNDAFSLTTDGDDLWVAPGGYLSTWEKLWNKTGVFHYNGIKWSNLNTLQCFDTITDVVSVAVDPYDENHVFLGSFSHGVVELDNEHVKNIFDHTNSSLGTALGWANPYVFISGVAFDSKNNLWVVNCLGENLLHSRTSRGVWKSYNIGEGGGFTGDLVIDRNDYKWVRLREGSFLVFNGSTTRKVSTTTGKGSLPGTANCAAVDSKGTVWIGTSDGIAEFPSSSRIFSSSTYSCSRILVPRDDGSGQADYLLSGCNVLSIAIDGDDNLWCGTSNGVFCISNDGLTEKCHFTMENSPLFSKTVNDIAVDGDGNVYFATDKGIISYRGRATATKSSNSDVVVFPNPVERDYAGVVGIRNLAKGTVVKITTTDGSFVTHLRAEGGQAIWDRTDIKGRPVDAGVYLIFLSDENGNNSYATKILLL